MITIFNMTKNTTELTEEQRRELFRCIDAYASTPDGDWLNGIDYHKFKYLWKSDLEGSDIQAIRPLIGDKIILQPNGKNPLFWVQIMAAPAIHELRHVWQRKKYGLIGYSFLAPLGRIPGFQETAPLEKDAFDQQTKSGNYIGKVIK
ncbi:MAG: hypothetical protein J6T08_08450 [Lentisphaeria bacterium]|nr:hypothetical protein [Lentisphaeria bacterium]